MAKLTERDVFEALRNLDTSFFFFFKPYNDDYAKTIKFHEDKRTSESNYFNAAGKVQKAIDKCLIREKSNFVRNDGDLEGDNLYNYDLYIAGVNVSHITDIEYYEYPLKKKIEYAQEFVKEFKQNYEKNKKRLEELTASPEIAEYNKLINVLDKIDNKGFFGRLTEESKIRQIRKRLEELKKYVDDYNNLKKYVKDYKDGDVVVENLPKLIEAIRERDAMYDVYRIYHNENRFNDSKEYLDYQNAKKQVLKYHQKELSDAIADVFGEEIEFEILDPQEKDEYLKQNKTEETQVFEEDEKKFVFNPKYTFDNFIIGKSNQYCAAAARAVAENPGQKFNPLFIYGGVGLGKTHLLHAIGNYIKQNNPKLKIQYVTCDQFTNDYIASLGTNKEKSTIKGTVEFREKYRNVDVLMVDDIQFISGRTSTQEEFFNTFNDLYQNNKQIIISSDRPPKEIETLADRLTSRLSCPR